MMQRLIQTTIDENHATELGHLIVSMKSWIKRPAAGALPFEYLCPSGPYDEQWDWDGFFMGVALATSAADEALYLQNWCLNFIQNADRNGFTPGVITRQGRDGRLHHMKPFLAQGAYLASKFLQYASWLQPYYQQIKTIVDYREAHMWDTTRDLGVWHDAMESGADNNVAFPRESDVKNRVAGADLNTFLYREYRAMAHLASTLDRPGDKEYYDNRTEALRTAINKYLWSDEDATYYNLDVVTGEWLQRVTYSNFVPLWEGLASESKGRTQIRRYLIEPRKLWAHYGIRTLAADDPAYNNANIIKPHSNWQGPVWSLTNYLFMHALLNYGFQDKAIEVAKKNIYLCLDDIKTSGGMHENYHADTGEPLAAAGFVSWNILVPQMLKQARSNTNPFALDKVELRI